MANGRKTAAKSQDTVALARLISGHTLSQAKASKVVADYAAGADAAEIADEVTAAVVGGEAGDELET